MVGVRDKAKELALALAGTKEFTDLKQARNIIYKNNELRNKVDSFLKEEGILFNGRLSPNEAQRKAAELKKTFDGLSTIPEVDTFLKAQKNFNNMIQNIYKILNDTLDLAFKS